MKTSLKAILCLAVVIVSPVQAADNTRNPLLAGIVAEPDLVYGKGGGEELKLDLFRPKTGDGPFPAVVFIHGGGWREGNRKNHVLTNIAPLLATRGYVAVSISYRLAPAAHFPTQVEDCKCAVRWLRANAAKYRIDKDRIGCTGISAGGHLVCMLGTARKEHGLEGNGGHAEQSSEVQAVVAFCPATDLTAENWKPELTRVLEDFVGGSIAVKREQFVKASPISYVKKGRKFPPFMFHHGTKDPLVNHNQSERLHEALLAAGGSSKLHLLDGEPHVWVGKKMENSIRQTIEFFDEQLKRK